MSVTIPQISIIMATYNRGHLIGETLFSIQNQTLVNWECLIIDDGSTDDTKEILKPFLEEEPRFKYLNRSSKYKKGLPGCRNYGLDLANGNYIVFFDDDDIVHPENLKICIEVINSNLFTFCRYDKKPFAGNWEPLLEDKNISKFTIEDFGKERIGEMITGKTAFASCCVMWKKKCFENIRFNEELQYAEEWECYSRILSLGFSGASINKILYYNRKHPHSNTGEFWKNDPIRKASNVKAVKLVIDNLKANQLLSYKLIKYFLRLGFLLKEPEIINYILDKSNASPLKKIKFKMGFKLYPIIKPILNLKGKILNN